MAEQGFTPPTSEWYYPAAEIVEQAIVPDYDAVYDLARQDPEAFWASQAEKLEWNQKWDKVLDDSNKPFYKWFVGGKTNMVLNALDRHVKTWRRNKLAIIWEGEDGDKVTTVILAAVARSQQIRQRAAQHGCEKRRPRHHLHGTCAGDRHRHVGLRQDRRATQRGLRRLFRASAGQPHRGRAEQGLDHLRWRLAARQDRSS